MDRNLLKSTIVKANLTDYEVASMCNIAKSSFSRKMNNGSEFKVSEVASLIQILNLTPDETMAIFFGGT